MKVVTADQNMLPFQSKAYTMLDIHKIIFCDILDLDIVDMIA
jgi:hypothetical protein